MKIQNKRILASILFVLISFVCIAQVPPPNDDPETAPIDGGVLVGAFIALAYGARKMLKNKE